MNGKLGLTKREERILRGVVFREPRRPPWLKDCMVSLAVLLALILVGPLLYFYASASGEFPKEIGEFPWGLLWPLVVIHEFL
jgi:hypothetical protein